MCGSIKVGSSININSTTRSLGSYLVGPKACGTSPQSINNIELPWYIRAIALLVDYTLYSYTRNGERPKCRWNNMCFRGCVVLCCAEKGFEHAGRVEASLTTADRLSKMFQNVLNIDEVNGSFPKIHAKLIVVRTSLQLLLLLLILILILIVVVEK